MNSIKEILNRVDSTSKLEEAFLVLLDFKEIGAVSFEDGQLRKSTYRDDGKRLSRWEVLDKFQYTEEEINNFFAAITAIFYENQNKSTLHLIDGSIHLTPNKKGLFVWKNDK